VNIRARVCCGRGEKRKGAFRCWRKSDSGRFFLLLIWIRDITQEEFEKQKDKLLKEWGTLNIIGEAGRRISTPDP
jgi:hypothetical protein